MLIEHNLFLCFVICLLSFPFIIGSIEVIVFNEPARDRFQTATLAFSYGGSGDGRELSLSETSTETSRITEQLAANENFLINSKKPFLKHQKRALTNDSLPCWCCHTPKTEIEVCCPTPRCHGPIDNLKCEYFKNGYCEVLDEWEKLKPVCLQSSYPCERPKPPKFEYYVKPSSTSQPQTASNSVKTYRPTQSTTTPLPRTTVSVADSSQRTLWPIKKIEFSTASTTTTVAITSTVTRKVPVRTTPTLKTKKPPGRKRTRKTTTTTTTLKPKTHRKPKRNRTRTQNSMRKRYLHDVSIGQCEKFDTDLIVAARNGDSSKVRCIISLFLLADGNFQGGLFDDDVLLSYSWESDEPEKVYFLVNQNFTFLEAKAACEKGPLNSRLASPLSPQEMFELEKRWPKLLTRKELWLLSDYKMPLAWIGAWKANGSNGTFSWVEGNQNLDITAEFQENWATGEPNNNGEFYSWFPDRWSHLTSRDAYSGRFEERCVGLIMDSADIERLAWNDLPCELPLAPALCRIDL